MVSFHAKASGADSVSRELTDLGPLPGGTGDQTPHGTVH